MFTFAKTLYRRVRQGEFPEGQERVPWGTTRRTAVNSFADVYSSGRTVCARAIVKWACPFFDQVSVVPWEHTVLPYGMVCANRLVRCAEVVAPYDNCENICLRKITNS